jgi:hypothetical protein
MQPAAQCAHGHAHQGLFGTIERGIPAEDVDRDFRFLGRLVAQGALGEVAQQLLAGLGLFHLFGGQELLQIAVDD